MFLTDGSRWKVSIILYWNKVLWLKHKQTSSKPQNCAAEADHRAAEITDTLNSAANFSWANTHTPPVDGSWPLTCNYSVSSGHCTVWLSSRYGCGWCWWRIKPLVTDTNMSLRCKTRYQEVVGPHLPGRLEGRLTQLHHVLVPEVRPVLRPALVLVDADKHTHIRFRRSLTSITHIKGAVCGF